MIKILFLITILALIRSILFILSKFINFNFVNKSMMFANAKTR